MKNKKIIMVGIGLTLMLAGCIEEEKEQQLDEIDIEVKEEIKEVKEKQYELTIEPTEHPVKNQMQMNSEHEHLMAKTYTESKGILTFRGTNRRDTTSYGQWEKEPVTFEKKWEIQTGWNHEWGGGAGWTGQPLVIEWEQDVLKTLGVKEEFKNEPLTEVIQASLDGKVYFIDLDSGKQTREPLDLGNPIKGTPALDPRGYPLLFVGEGIPQDENISLNAINLVTNKVIYEFAGLDTFANRWWGAFDPSPLISKETDTLVTNGENGIVYNVKLNTKYDKETGELSIEPKSNKMTFTHPDQGLGMESSIVAEGKYLFTADNKGMIQAIDSKTMKTLWSVPSYDDSDSTMIYTEEKREGYLYTASQIDKQGTVGHAKIRKIKAQNGEVIWEKDFPGYSIIGDDPVNGGFLASPLKGQGKLTNQMIFTMARGETLHSGYLFALNMETGQEEWRWDMSNYAWSSPAGITDKQGNFYIVQADSAGNVDILKNGPESIFRVNVGANVEASPIIYEENIIFASRGGQILNFELE